MSAIVNIFDSAFNDNHRTIKVEEGLRIEEVEELDWENTLIYVNGFERKKEYKIRDNDVVTIRQYPSDWEKVGQVAGWVFMPVTSAIVGGVTGEWDGAINNACRSIRDSIINSTTKKPDEQEDVGQSEKLPTISGAKNRSGAGQPIPLLFGESMYTPITLAQGYTTVSGVDGEDQIYHGLYCLGYNDVDVKSVSLGIYQLTSDEKNGTSGTFSCTNIQKRTFTKRITIGIIPVQGSDFWIPIAWLTAEPIGSRVITYNLNSVYPDYDMTGISSVEGVVANCTAYLTIGGLELKTGYSVGSSVSYSGSSVVITANQLDINSLPASVKLLIYLHGGKYTVTYCCYLAGNFTVSCTETYDNTHYPYQDQISGGKVVRKGYYQQLELQQKNSNEVSLYPQKVIQENFGTELMYPEGASPLVMQPFSAKYPQTVQLEVMFQNLVFYHDDGSMGTNEVYICAGYSTDGGVSFQPFANFSSSGGITVTPSGTTTDAQGTYSITKFVGCKNKAMRFVATKTFSKSAVFDCKNNVVEFKIWRYSEDKSITNQKNQYKCYFTAIRTWCYDYEASKTSNSLVAQRPIIAKYKAMTARLGFSIRAGDELQGTIDELNVRMISRARYCTITTDEQTGEKTYTWSAVNSTIPTNNPASLALMILEHPMRGEYAYTDDDLDMESFGKFYEFCEQTDTELRNSNGRKYTANGVLSRETKTIDLVNQILSCGHGRLIINGNKYGIVWDKIESTPVMVLNNQNVLEAKNTKTFSEDIDGYSCKFLDSLNNYQQDTQIFVPDNVRDPESPDYKPASEYKLESIELNWITDCQRAYRMCMYMLACRKLRPEVWEVKLGVDGALLDIGCLVDYQSDSLSVGIGDGAQITQVNTQSGDIVSIEVDYGFNVTDTEQEYGVTVQHTDPTRGVTVRTYPLESFATTGTKTVLTFTEPIDSATVIKPTEGDIVSFGIFNKISTPATVYTKKQNTDGTYTITLIPYNKDIYDAEYGLIPEYETNVTSPRDAGVEVSEELPPVTLDQVGEVAQAVMNQGTDEPPSEPTDLTAVAEEIGIQLKWTPVEENGLNNTIKHYVIEKSTDSGENWTELGTTFNSDYFYVFNRSVDKYPEKLAPEVREQGMVYLSDYRFRIKAVNIYGYESEYVTSTINVSNYGTWKIPQFAVTKEVIDRTVILTAVYTGTVQKVYGLNRLKVWIKRNGNTDAEGGQSFNQILHVEPDTTWYTPEFSESVMGSESVNTEKNYHKFENGTALTVPYETNSYKISHTLPLMGQCPRLYNGTDYVGITGDAVVVPSITEVEEVPSSPVENQIILYSGETDEHFTEGKWYIYKTSWEELSDGFFIKYNGADGDYTNGLYYVLDETWVELIKKNPQLVPTEYIYKMTMYNESCEIYPQNAREATDTYVQALCTNISDIVHSHEHYKDLYVEKLSAISANIGLISEGGMGDFAHRLNYWALSNLSPEDSGTLNGVKRGAFRVGGTDQFFLVEPDENDPNKFNIELRAGSINLTSDVDREGFVNGTYIYEGAPETATRRLHLTSQGIVVESRPDTEITWKQGGSETARIEIDKRDNLIITNADREDIPPFGYHVDENDVIYHFDDAQNPTDEEVGEGETPSNPKSLDCRFGEVVQNDDSTLLNKSCSPSSFEGTVSMSDSSKLSGNIVFFNKADKVVTSGKGICVNDETKAVTVETAIPLLTGYNDAMKETSTIDASKTVGEYLGLTQQQVNNVIFY